MDMNIIVCSLLLFLALMIIHIVVWRVIKPRKHIISLFVFFIIMPGMIAVVSLVTGISAGITNQGVLLIFFLYFAFSLVYIQTYPAVQGHSPSLQIVYMIGHSEKGMDIKDLLNMREFNAGNLIDDHISNLQEEGFISISKTDNSVRLTSKGRMMASMFMLYRKFLGLDVGEG